MACNQGVKSPEEVMEIVEIVASKVNTDFLPLMYEVIKSLERDTSYEPSQKLLQSQDISLKVLDIQRMLDVTRRQVGVLMGIERSKEEQAQQFRDLRYQLVQKKELIEKYKNMYSFDS